MTARIKLIKLKEDDLKFIRLIIARYINHLQKPLMKPEERKDESILTELWHILESRLAKQHIPKTNSLNLLYHQAAVVEDALLYYQKYELYSNDLGNVKIEQYKFMLNPQIVQ